MAQQGNILALHTVILIRENEDKSMLLTDLIDWIEKIKPR